MFSEETMSIRIDNNTLTIYSDGQDSTSSNEFDNMSVISVLKGNYAFDVQYPNGIHITRVNENEIRIKHLHVNATLLLDECKLLYPLEIDSLRGLFKMWPILQ